jgi:hypothetical protein
MVKMDGNPTWYNGVAFQTEEVNRKSNIIIKVVKGLFNMLVQFQLLHEACFIGQYQHSHERIGSWLDWEAIWEYLKISWQ